LIQALQGQVFNYDSISAAQNRNKSKKVKEKECNTGLKPPSGKQCESPHHSCRRTPAWRLSLVRACVCVLSKWGERV